MNELQRYFKERNITVKQIARITGLHVSRIYPLLNGNAKINGEHRPVFINAFPGIEPFLNLALKSRREKTLDCIKRMIEDFRASPTNECVEWPFACAPTDGYGRVWTGQKLVTAHRLAYELYHGSPATQCVLHDCDNPKCINPLHLHDGSRQQNLREYAERGPSKFSVDIQQRRREYYRQRRNSNHS